MNVLILLFVTSALSAVMLMVLRSLAPNAVAGLREWALANAMAVAALPLYAGRGHLPDPLSIDAANLLLLCAPVLMHAGFARHLGRRPPWGALAALLLVSTVSLALFRYALDAMAVRIALTSLFHGAVCALMACGLRRAALPAHQAGARYPARFAFWAATLLAAGYGVRFALYAARYDADVSIFDSTPLNLAFLALGTLAMPTLTLGAVMMAYAGVIARTTYAAEHDFLTGAWSRRAFFDLAGRERARAARSSAPLSLLVFDVDHFKAINDSQGHAVGDRVLTDIVARTATVIRGADACARLGGEEFAVLLPGSCADVARGVAERLRRVLEQGCVHGAGADLVRYTVSVGVATMRVGETVDSLLERADAALYAAKAGGRNRVAVADAFTGLAA